MEDRLADAARASRDSHDHQHQREQAKKFNVDVIDMKAWELGTEAEGRPSDVHLTRSRRARSGVRAGCVASGTGWIDRARSRERDSVDARSDHRGGHRRAESDARRQRSHRVVAAKFVKEIAARMIEIH